MKLPACPRCDAVKTLKIAESPVPDKFEIYRCPECNYVWRSIEDLSEISKNMIDTWRKHANREMLQD